VRLVPLLLALLLAGLCAAPAASAATRVRVGWSEASGAAVRPGERLTVRLRVSGTARARRPLADVALLALAATGKPQARLARRRARARTIRLRVPRTARGHLRLRVRVAGRTRTRRFYAAPRTAPAPEPVPAPGSGAPPAAPGPVCDEAAQGSAVASAGAPAAARAGESVGLLVTNTGPTCLESAACPALEAQAPDGTWVEALDEERVCPAVAVLLTPGAARRYEFALPPGTPPGSYYRLVLTLAGPDTTLEATTPIEVLPPG